VRVALFRSLLLRRINRLSDKRRFFFSISPIRMKATQSLDRRERVLLLGVNLRKSLHSRSTDSAAIAQESLAELKELAFSAGAEISEIIVQSRDALDPATLVAGASLKRFGPRHTPEK